MSRIRPIARVVAATVFALALTHSAAAQVPPGVGEGWMGEFDHAARQLLQLAEAIPAEKFAWRPAPGVRSIAEVYMHIGVANQHLVSRMGAKPTADLSAMGKDPEKSITEKAGVIKFLEDSFDAVRSAYKTADRQKVVKLFNKEIPADNVFVRILVHNHEHMGQAIAYARMNGIAPPWSAGSSQ